MKQTSIHLDRVLFTDDVRVYIQVAERQFVSNLIISTLEEGMIPPEAMTLSNSEAQRLMDELWHIGLRPSEGSGSAGALAATQKHLEDMRTIVFSHGISGVEK